MKTSSPNHCTEERKVNRLAIAISFAVVMLFQGLGQASFCWAQENEKQVLGLEQMIRMAIGRSPEIAEVQSQIAASRSDLAQVDAAYYPQLDSNTLVGPVRNGRRPTIIGDRITDPSADLSIGVFGRSDLTVTQPLYTFGKLSNRKEAAARGVAAKELGLTQKENETALRVKELYFGLVLARAGIESSRGGLAYFDEARSRIKRLLDAGSPNVLESDIYKIDAYMADTLRSRAEAEKGAAIAYFALKSLIRLPPDKEFEPADKMLSMREVALDEVDAYVRKALAERPELKQLDQAAAARKSTLEAARSDLYPSFFSVLAGSFAGAPGSETLHNAYIPDQFNHVYAGVAGGMNWHFDFGITKARIEKEKVEYEGLLHTKAFGEIAIPIEVVDRYQEVLEWKAAVDAYGKGAAASRKWIVAALANFDTGIGTADDMLRGMEKYGQNQGRYLEALFTYNMSLARLEYATGMRSW
jgi:outer membrane protein TolC